MNILLLGSGGREHALAWKIAQSPLCGKLYIAPGNAGTELHGENAFFDICDVSAVSNFVRSREIDLVVVGPEEPLVRGLGDHFRETEELAEVMFFGPGASGARLEGSKDFAKSFMQRHSIPSAAYRSFTRRTFDDACAFVDSLPPPYVLKADGLAAGKGVLICNSREEARDALDRMLCKRMFGDASCTVLVEEFLEGKEMSVFVITDGTSYMLLPSAKDYKRVGEKDTGANTGGMGAVSPVPFADNQLMERIERTIVKPTISGLNKEGIGYCGFLFFGLMIVGSDPYVIEYNARMGDPEAQAIIPRIDSDLVPLMAAACAGRISEQRIRINSGTAVTVFLTSGGYPDAFDKGFEIRGVEDAEGSYLFYGGVRRDDGRLVTNGGRVIAVTSLDNSLESARAITYKNTGIIDFRGKYYRRDIGRDLLKRPE